MPIISWFKSMFIAVLSIPLLSYADENDLDYKFTQADSSYTFYGSFNVNAEPDCLINLIYDFDNISDYSSAAESIELIRAGNDWYEITFTYRKYLFFEHQSTWRRTLNRKKHKVDFIMISNNINSSMIPEMVSSSGYYQVKPKEENCRVFYYQTCTLRSGVFLNTYMKVGKDAAINFIQEFKKFIEKNCGHLYIDSTEKKGSYD